jgi:hypothetical protein
MLMTQVFFASDFLLISSKQARLQLGDGKDDGNEADLSFVERLKVAVMLFFNRRGLGTNFQARGIPTPPSPTTTRTSFLLSRLRDAFLCYLAVDFAVAYQMRNPVFRPDSPIPSVAAQGTLLRAINVISWAVPSYSIIKLQHTMLSMVFVGLGISGARMWPELFGGVGEMFTIRRFWSRGWHQMFQRTFRTHAQYVSHTLLRLPSISPLNLIIQLFVAFLVSAIIHSLGDRMMNPAGGSSFKFFLVQPFGILLEEAFHRLLATTDLWDFKQSQQGWRKVVARFVGYLWVIAWFQYWMVEWIDNQVRAGLACSILFPVSVAEGVLTGKWVR